ncbi:nucleoside triphosphate pyrophosphohydrolase [Pseudomonas phage vB_PsaM_M1]|nr:nucleoside triphosphate pyrophosphohydrolase [Pseudomonas phage vB_PsaM_M1]
MKQFAELYKRVVAFNDKAGVKMEPFDTPNWWKAVELQAKLLVEESQESLDAAELGDKVELVDGCIDVLFLGFMFANMLQQAGYDVIGAFEAVCDNNDSKVFSSYYEAVEEKEQLEERDDQEYTIETSVYDGMPYYSVRRFDGKIMKKVGFVPVNLDEFVP